MPPAIVIFLGLSWIERDYLRPAAPPQPPQVDTVLKSAAIERTVEGAVVIEAEPEPFVAEANEVGAARGSLEKVRDDTVFRPGDDEAWFQIWMTLRSSSTAALRSADPRQVSFAELFGQPRSFRGRLVRFSGTMHRLQKVQAPPNDYDINSYWQAWVEPDGGPASPIVVYFLTLPAGLPEGMKLSEPVDVIGYFFKRWAYQATDTIRTAPLVMALEPIWKPHEPPAPGGTVVGSYALLAMGALVAVTLLGLRFANTGSARRPPSPTDLSTALADVELFSPEKALQKIAADERATERGQAQTAAEQQSPGNATDATAT